MAALEIRLLGNGSLRVHGNAPTLARKEFWLLAYLALHSEQEVSRERLAALLWPETDEEKARFYLRKALTSLRHALSDFSERLLAPTPRTLRLDLAGSDVFCDALAFDTATTPRQKVDLYTGPLLPDCYEDWVLPERERRAMEWERARAATQRPPAAPALPCPLTELLGRARELEELGGWLKRCRLVTLSGPGGAGKTRLAIAVAEAVQPQFAQGAWFVDLASLSAGSGVAAATLKALQRTEGPGQTPLEALLELLMPGNYLLVLDNAEHVVEDTAALALTLLTRCPRLKVLITSRQALGLTGEQVYPVLPLALPPAEVIGPGARPELREKDPLTLLDYAALRLFVERATQANPAFRLTRGNMEAVARICCGLDGMPLAIEMAASRVAFQAVDDIACQLARRLDFLAAGNQAVPERQRSLQAAIEWSYNLLAPEEQQLFRSLAVFYGGWTTTMAEALFPGAAELLPDLIRKSLVVFQPGSGEAEPRFSLLQTLQQFATARAREGGEWEALQARHLEYFRKRTELSLERLVGPEMVSELKLLEREYGNIRAALQFGCDSANERYQADSLTIAANIRRFWMNRNNFAEALYWFEKVLALPGCQQPGVARGYCQLGLGYIYLVSGQVAQSEELFELCLAEQTALGNYALVAIAHTSLGGVCQSRVEPESAVRAFRSGVQAARLSGHLNTMAHCTVNLGICLMSAGTPEEATALLEEGMELAYRQGNKQLVGSSLGVLGELAVRRGDVERACELGQENLKICEEIGRNHPLAIAMNHLGMFLESAGDFVGSRYYKNSCLYLSQELGIRDQATSVFNQLAVLDRKEGHLERATTIWGAGMALRAQHGVFPYDNEEELELLRELMGATAFEAALERGGKMTLDEAIAYAVQLPG